MKNQMPVDIAELTKVEGLGHKTVKTLYQKLKIKNLDDLEKAAKAGRISKLPRFSQKTEENILQGIKFIKANQGSFLLGAVLPIARQIQKQIKKMPHVKRIQAAGFLKNGLELLGALSMLGVK